jgi:benzodiazapine receptor
MEQGKGKSYAGLVVAIVLCQIAGIIGSLFTTAAISTWYANLHKPSIAPPNWVFAPVWTTLYLLMGISLFMIWNSGLDKSSVRRSLLVFSIQLALNVLWSYLFFGLRSPLLGLIGIVALWFTIVLTIVFFFRVSKVAGVLLIPYLAWVSLAGYLNYLIFILNP